MLGVISKTGTTDCSGGVQGGVIMRLVKNDGDEKYMDLFVDDAEFEKFIEPLTGLLKKGHIRYFKIKIKFA